MKSDWEYDKLQREVKRLTERVAWLEGEREQYLSDKRLLEAEAERLRASERALVETANGLQREAERLRVALERATDALTAALEIIGHPDDAVTLVLVGVLEHARTALAKEVDDAPNSPLGSGTTYR